MKQRKLLTILVINLFLLNLTSTCLACWGTRPLAMGGAFTGLADDANAIYWNPAGLALSSRVGVTGMHNAGEMNDSNYDEYLAIALPMGSYGTLGAALTSNNDILYASDGTKNGSRRDNYYQLGFGGYLKKDWNLSLGVSVKAVTQHTGAIQTEWSDIDLGVLWGFGQDVGTKKMFSLGFLLQNATEAQFLKRDNTTKMVRNFRPGVGFHPDKKTTFSLEVYDALGETRDSPNSVSQNLRLGAERWLSDTIVLRLGGYHVNNADMRAYTGGIGLKAPASWGVDLELDWTLMYWDKAGGVTQFVGLTCKL